MNDDEEYEDDPRHGSQRAPLERRRDHSHFGTEVGALAETLPNHVVDDGPVDSSALPVGGVLQDLRGAVDGGRAEHVDRDGSDEQCVEEEGEEVDLGAEQVPLSPDQGHAKRMREEFLKKCV